MAPPSAKHSVPPVFSSDPPPPPAISGKRTYADSAHAPPAHARQDNALPKGLQPLNKRRRVRRSTRPASTLRALMQGELGVGRHEVEKTLSQLKFRGFGLDTSVDAHHGREGMGRRRMKILEITSRKELVFCLSTNGVCVVFNRELRKKVCVMNITEDEVIRSLFLNKLNDAIITVSVFQKDEFSSLHCRSTPLSHVRRGYLKSALPIFESESLRWPGFVEFDDVNGKILTCSSIDRKYKVWDLKTYKHLYTVKYEGIDEIKISPGIMLLILARQERHIPIRILDVETGQLLREVNHLIQHRRKIDFIEQFHSKLLLKQQNENLQIIDVLRGTHVEIERSHFLMPNAFIFLYESELFLTFQRREVSVWNFKGERVTTFEDHTLFHPDTNSSTIYITQMQDIIVSYCQQDGCPHGTINISRIDSGKLLGKITCDPRNPLLIEQQRAALQGVSALYYNEERNEIYTGTKNGYLNIWTN